MFMANLTAELNPVSTDGWIFVWQRYLDERSHGEKVGQHGGETLSQTTLGNEAEL